MGWTDMFTGPKKEKASVSEKSLGILGKGQLAFTPQFEAAHSAVLQEAQADHTGYLRGRGNADVMQSLAGDMGTNNMVQQRNSRQPMYEKLSQEALGSALGEATNRGVTLRDAIIKEGAGSRLANAEASGRSLAQDARTKFEEASKKTQLANQWANDMRDAAFTVGSAYMFNKGMQKPPAGGVPTSTPGSYSPARTVQLDSRLNSMGQSIDYSPVTPKRWY